jgi:hypothetical protein
MILEWDNFLMQPFLAALVLLVWFRTNAAVEYLELLCLGGCFLRDFKEKSSREGLDFKEYILLYKNCFFVRLLCCPICLGVWINIFLCLGFENFEKYFVYTVVSLILYYTMVLLGTGSNEKN